MKAYVFPGQGSQFPGMGKELYENSEIAKYLFEEANEILGYRLSDIMFEGTAEELTETRVTQPAVFLHSIVTARMHSDSFHPDMVAGHSLGELSALVSAGSLAFDKGLKLVQQRALAMQEACEMQKGTMAAVIGAEDELIEKICAGIKDHVVVPANYNCPGQLVISGTVEGIEEAVRQLNEQGARTIVLQVGGAFHSPLMEPAKDKLRSAIEQTDFRDPEYPVYQNVSAMPETDAGVIKQNLIDQLTAPVKWTQTMRRMLADGMTMYIEVGGNGKVLQGFMKKMDRRFATDKL